MGSREREGGSVNTAVNVHMNNELFTNVYTSNYGLHKSNWDYKCPMNYE